MDFKDYYNLTPAARTAARGTTASRPFHADWPNEQMTSICDFVVHNAWVRSVLGPNVDVSIQIAKDNGQLMLLFTKVE
jgi:hypothetical protein